MSMACTVARGLRGNPPPRSPAPRLPCRGGRRRAGAQQQQQQRQRPRSAGQRGGGGGAGSGSGKKRRGGGDDDEGRPLPAAPSLAAPLKEKLGPLALFLTCAVAIVTLGGTVFWAGGAAASNTELAESNKELGPKLHEQERRLIEMLGKQERRLIEMLGEQERRLAGKLDVLRTKTDVLIGMALSAALYLATQRRRD